MGTNCRTKNALLNTVVGISTQVGMVFFTFLERKIFIYYLSVDYLGINGLFSNILSLLSLSELGISSVVVFYLYKPVYENDERLITSIVLYFNKVYRVIASIMIVFGVMVIPFLGRIVSSELSSSNLIVYYVIFLLNSIVTIPLAPRIALLHANQNQRLQKKVLLCSKFLLMILHMGILVLTHNYMLYVLLTLLITISTQIVLLRLIDKKYTYLKIKKIDSFVLNKDEVFEKVKAVFLCKIGSTIINSTDNILISTIVSTAAVGLYSNYSTITGSITAFISVVCSAMSSAIGNLSAQKNSEKLYLYFKFFLLLYQMIGVFCCLGFFFLVNDFITWWIGADYLLDLRAVIAISLRLLIFSVGVPIWTYRDANGLFEKVKYMMLVNALINIAFSIVAGKYYGIAGIILATSLADILTSYYIDPYVVYTNIFHKRVHLYWTTKIRLIIPSVLTFLFCFFLFENMQHDFGMIIIRGILLAVIELLVFGVCMYNTDEITVFVSLLKRIKGRLTRG